ncbi:hypothetical protein IGI04_016054 [Brassica rapa subsp. trilocularis]|uniref:Uncharacterized protein n=1 Tax=Brassica rapa subsp. trilocularis TaxID=1813537 RepID=A0ABQ7MRU9_BRACM|nr:hypothetical protein IGI04_016054 [Brassica rapa subsp. trilocularis]
MPTQALVNNTGVNVESPLRHPASVETEAIPLVSSHNSTSVTASTSETLHFPKTAVLSPIAGLIETFTSSTFVPPVPLLFSVTGTLSLPTSVVDMNCESRLGGLGSNSKPLVDIKGLNMFENIALMDEELASDDVFSPCSCCYSELAKDESGAKVVAASSNSLDMAQKIKLHQSSIGLSMSNGHVQMDIAAHLTSLYMGAKRQEYITGTTNTDPSSSSRAARCGKGRSSLTSTCTFASPIKIGSSRGLFVSIGAPIPEAIQLISFLE